jgi:hypothetical protein
MTLILEKYFLIEILTKLKRLPEKGRGGFGISSLLLITKVLYIGREKAVDIQRDLSQT